jgi:hypothetical protein
MRRIFSATCFWVCQLFLAVSWLHAQETVPTVLDLEVLASSRYGFSYLGTFTNREKADFVFAATGNDLALDLRVFDIDNGTEVSVLLNGAFFAYLPTTVNNGASHTTLTFPADSLISGDNKLSFVQRLPDSRWGITDLLLSENGAQSVQLNLDAPDTNPYGFSYRGTSANRRSADFVFAATSNDLTLDLRVFDIDNATEVSVLLNGAFVGYLPTTANNGTGHTSLTFSADSLVSGNNSISFVQRLPGSRWGITDLLLSESDGQSVQLSLDVLDTNRYGFSYRGTSTNRRSADFVFAAIFFDIDLLGLERVMRSVVSDI